MIGSIRHKGLRQLFEDDSAKGVGAEYVRKLRQILAALDAAEAVEGVNLPTFGHASPERRAERVLGDHRARKLASDFPF